MNQLQQQWLDALRSGKYQQGTGVLKSTNNTFCCLGVLCDVVDPNGWRTSLDGDSCFDHHGMPFTIPDGLRKLVDLDHGDVNTVIAMNDGSHEEKRHTFLEIADYLEQQFKANAAGATTV